MSEGAADIRGSRFDVTTFYDHEVPTKSFAVFRSEYAPDASVVTFGDLIRFLESKGATLKFFRRPDEYLSLEFSTTNSFVNALGTNPLVCIWNALIAFEPVNGEVERRPATVSVPQGRERRSRILAWLKSVFCKEE